MRRQCQEILPGLLLGPLQASKDLDTLKSLGVTHMYVRQPSEVGSRLITAFIEYAYGMRRKPSLSAHASQTSSATLCSTSRTAKNRISSDSFLSTLTLYHPSHAEPL